MSKSRKIAAIGAIVAIVIAIISFGWVKSASAAPGDICNTPVLRISTDTPRSTFVDFYNDKGTRIAFAVEKGFLKKETRTFTVCDNEVSYDFTKFGPNARWILAR